jgi:hypothetical protein
MPRTTALNVLVVFAPAIEAGGALHAEKLNRIGLANV